jgi:transcription elongation factor GreA-like protein
MFKAGDYILHSRQGPGRIVEVLPQHIVVRPRSGNVYKVNIDIADNELAPVPSDGFIALLAQHDYSSERSLQQVPEIVERIMRDKHRRSISRGIKAELAPFLAREGKPFVTWWKLAQRKILESGKIVPKLRRRARRGHLLVSA